METYEETRRQYLFYLLRTNHGFFPERKVAVEEIERLKAEVEVLKADVEKLIAEVVTYQKIAADLLAENETLKADVVTYQKIAADLLADKGGGDGD